MSHRHEAPTHHPPPPGGHYYYPPPPGYPPYPYPPGIYSSSHSPAKTAQRDERREEPRRESHKEPVHIQYDMPPRESYEEYMKKYYQHHPVETHYPYPNLYPPPPPGHIPPHYPVERPGAYVKPRSRSKSPRRRTERRPSPRKRSYSPPLKKRPPPRARSYDRKRSETPPKYKKRPIMSRRPPSPLSRKRSRTPPRPKQYNFSTTKKDEVYTKKAALERYHKEKEEKAKKMDVYIRKEKSKTPVKDKPIQKVVPKPGPLQNAINGHLSIDRKKVLDSVITKTNQPEIKKPNIVYRKPTGKKPPGVSYAYNSEVAGHLEKLVNASKLHMKVTNKQEFNTMIYNYIDRYFFAPTAEANRKNELELLKAGKQPPSAIAIKQLLAFSVKARRCFITENDDFDGKSDEQIKAFCQTQIDEA